MPFVAQKDFIQRARAKPDQAAACGHAVVDSAADEPAALHLAEGDNCLAHIVASTQKSLEGPCVRKYSQNASTL